MEVGLDKSNQSMADVDSYLTPKQKIVEREVIKQKVFKNKSAHTYYVPEIIDQPANESNLKNPNFLSKFRKEASIIKKINKSRHKIEQKQNSSSNFINHFLIIKELKKKKEVRLIDMLFDNEHILNEKDIKSKIIAPTEIKIAKKEKTLEEKSSTATVNVYNVEFETKNRFDMAWYGINPLLLNKRKLKKAVPQQRNYTRYESKNKSIEFYEGIFKRSCTKRTIKKQKAVNLTMPEEISSEELISKSLQKEMIQSIVASKIILPIRPLTCKPVFDPQKSYSIKKLTKRDEPLDRWLNNEEDYIFE